MLQALGAAFSYCYAECCYGERRYAERRYAERRYAERRSVCDFFMSVMKTKR
jgi:hypothetical protein